MVQPWYETKDIQRICTTLRTELPRLPRRVIGRETTEPVFLRRMRLLKRVHLLLHRVPDSVLTEFGPGTLALKLEPFIAGKYPRKVNLHYFRQGTADGFGYIADSNFGLRSAQDFDRELLSIDPDALLDHLRSRSPAP